MLEGEQFKTNNMRSEGCAGKIITYMYLLYISRYMTNNKNCSGIRRYMYHYL